MPIFSLEGREHQLRKQKEEKFRQLEKEFGKKNSAIYSEDFLAMMKASWLVERGAYLADNENLELGGNDFKAALEIDPDNISVRQVLAMYYRQSGDPKAALDIITKTKKSTLTETSIGVIAFLREAALTYYALGQRAKSLETLEVAIKQATKNKAEIQKSSDEAVRVGLDLGGEIDVDADIEEMKEMIKEIKKEKSDVIKKETKKETDELDDWDADELKDWDNIK